jgi:hypothetical protein
MYTLTGVIEMKESEKGRACSTNMTEEKFLENFDHKTAIGTDHLERRGGFWE